MTTVKERAKTMTTVREILDRFLASKETTFEKVLIDEIEHCGVDAAVGDVIDSAFEKLGTSVNDVVCRYLSDHGLSGLCDEMDRMFYNEDDDFTEDEYYLNLLAAIKEPCTDHECCVQGCPGPDDGGFHFWPDETHYPRIHQDVLESIKLALSRIGTKQSYIDWAKELREFWRQEKGE